MGGVRVARYPRRLSTQYDSSSKRDDAGRRFMSFNQFLT